MNPITCHILLALDNKRTLEWKIKEMETTSGHPPSCILDGSSEFQTDFASSGNREEERFDFVFEEAIVPLAEKRCLAATGNEYFEERVIVPLYHIPLSLHRCCGSPRIFQCESWRMFSSSTIGHWLIDLCMTHWFIVINLRNLRKQATNT